MLTEVKWLATEVTQKAGAGTRNSSKQHIIEALLSAGRWPLCSRDRESNEIRFSGCPHHCHPKGHPLLVMGSLLVLGWLGAVWAVWPPLPSLFLILKPEAWKDDRENTHGHPPVSGASAGYENSLERTLLNGRCSLLPQGTMPRTAVMVSSHGSVRNPVGPEHQAPGFSLPPTRAGEASTPRPNRKDFWWPLHAQCWHTEVLYKELLILSQCIFMNLHKLTRWPSSPTLHAAELREWPHGLSLVHFGPKAGPASLLLSEVWGTPAPHGCAPGVECLPLAF